MKHLKKFSALLLAMVMILSLSVTAFAAGSGSITITNAVVGETYTAYKLFDVTSADTNNDGTKDAYSYYVKADITDGNYSKPTLVTQLEAMGLSFTVSADGSEYLVNTGMENEELKFSKTEGDSTTYVTAAELAQKINSALKEDTPTITLTPASSIIASIPEGETAVSVTISNLDAGYYFVDSSLGSLCALGTAADTVEIYEKNTAPTITKEVANDLSDNTYQAYGDGDVIDTINYKLTVNTGSKQNIDPTGTGVDADYTIADTLPTGITHNKDSVSIQVGNEAAWTISDDYTVEVSGQVMTIVLKNSKLTTLNENTSIVITYTATMDRGTVHIDAAGEATGNTNNVELTYKAQKPKDSAVVYTYQIGGTKTGDGGTTIPVIQKVDADSKEGDNYTKALNGVKFVLSKDVGTAETPNIKYATVDDNGILTGWKDTQADATKIETKQVTLDDNNTIDGVLTVKGLDQGTYILTEVETLPGYNLMDDTITVIITSSVDDTGKNTVDVTYQYTRKVGQTGENAGTEIVIENETGSLLPSTGGMGTTIFYIVGAILVLGAAVLLVTKRRMNADK